MGVVQKSGFWDSVDPSTGEALGDEREYWAKDITTPFEYLVTNGVQTGGEFLKVVPAAFDYTVGIQPGLAWIRGRWYVIADDGLGGATTLMLQGTAPTTYNRIDRVVLRYDSNFTLAGRDIYAALVQGVEGAVPVAPALTRTTEIYEICLNEWTVKPGQPTVLVGDLSDKRFDAALCGIADFAPNPGMAPYIAQFQADLQAMADELLANIDDGNITDMMADIAALEGAMTTVQGRATTLEGQTAKQIAEDTPITTTGTQPNYSIAVPRLSAGAPLEAGFRQKIYFHAIATADATIALTGTGGYTVTAKNLFQDADKRAKPKKQYVYIEYDGTSLFLCGSGGGTELPSTIAAGDTIIRSDHDAVWSNSVGAVVRTVTTKINGTYRFVYNCWSSLNGYTAYIKLQKNGVDVPSSEITNGGAFTYSAHATIKIIDVVCVANDVITAHIRSNSGTAVNNVFKVSILWADLATEIAKVI